MRVLYTTTVGKTMGFFTALVGEMVGRGDVVDIATNEVGGTDLVPGRYREWGCKVHAMPWTRSPFKFGNLKAIYDLKKVVEAGGYDVVHCHTPVAAACTRLACRKARKRGTKVFYTAHGFHFYKGAPLLNWLVYYPVERALARLTDVLITINREDYERAKRFKAGKVVYVPGVGVDMNRFVSVPGMREEKRTELSLADGDFALLSVGELNANKNHAAVIRALGELARRGRLGGLRYLVCGQGPLEDDLKRLAASLGVGDRLELLGYRDDIAQLLSACDAFVFPSKREGLPVALMEAMAAGLPCVCTPIRGNVDLVNNGVTGLVAVAEPASLADALDALMADEGLRERLGMAAVDAVKRFDFEGVLDEMWSIYDAVGCRED